MYRKKQEPAINDRVHLKCAGRKLVIEFIEYPASWDRDDIWRLIDLKTGEAFAESQLLHDLFQYKSLIQLILVLRI